MLVSGVIIEADMHDLAGWHFRLDRVQEADKLLMPVTLHVAPDNRPIEDIQRGKERRRSMALVIMCHGSGAAFLQRQAWLGPVERLDLAFLIETEDDGMGGRIDIEADHVPQLVDELGIVRELELAHPMRLEAVRTPDALDGADADSGRLSHHGASPVRCLARRVGERQSDDTLGHFAAKRLNARGPRLVTKQALEAFLHEPLLPTPDTGFRRAATAHDLRGADTVRAEQDDLGPPDMLLSGITIADQTFKTMTIRRREGDGNSRAHPPDCHSLPISGILERTQSSDLIH